MPEILNASGASTGGGLVNNVTNKIKNPFNRSVNKPDYAKGDFSEGLKFVEIINGVPRESEAITLIGNMLPMDSIPFGGTQRIVKDFYPGKSEPTLQIFGPQEGDVVIKGRLKDKRYNDLRFKHVSTDIQRQIDAIRIRGNLLKITLGSWKRYGVLEETRFDMKNLGDYDYELKFNIIGFNPPQNCLFVENSKEVPTAINNSLISAAVAWQSKYSSIPDSVPRSIGEELNDAIGVVAGAIAQATNFVDTVLGAGEQVLSSIDRALGLVKNARANISAYKRRVGKISNDVASLGSKARSAASIVPFAYRSAAHILESMNGLNLLAAFLAQIQTQLKALRVTVPQARHRVVQGDTLQKLANRFYTNQDEWKRIYDHNKLSSTVLQSGKVLEIPRL